MERHLERLFRPLSRFIAILRVTLRRIAAQPALAVLGLVGLSLPVALMMSIPIYADNIYRRVLIDEIKGTENLYRTESIFDFVFHYNGGYGKRSWNEVAPVDSYIREQAGLQIGLPHEPVLRQFLTQEYELYIGEFESRADTPPAWVQFAFIDDIERHIRLVEGEFPAATSGEIQALVSQAAANERGMQVGDRLTIFTPEDESRIPVRVSGIWEPQNPTENFWFIPPEVLEDRLVTSEAGFIDQLPRYVDTPVYMAWWFLSSDGDRIHTNDVDPLVERITHVHEEVRRLLPKIEMTTLPLQTLLTYQRSVRLLSLVLTLYSLPVVGLLIAFIALVAFLTIQRQRNEMAMLRSRGASSSQILGLVGWEGLLLGMGALLIGIPLSFGLAQGISRTRSFLEFSASADFRTAMTRTSVILGLTMLGIGLAIQFLPARRAARKTIVDYKRERARTPDRAWWKRVGLDLWLLVPAGYGAYLLRAQQSLGILDPLQNRNPFQNPLLFLVPALAALSVALLALRVLPALLSGIVWIGSHTRSVSLLMASRHLARHPAAYTIPILLLVLTLSMSTYTASLAGTLDRDLHDRAYYHIGADMVFLDIGEGGPDVSPSDFTGERQVTLTPSPSPDRPWTFPPVSVYLELPGVRDVARVGRYAATWREASYSTGVAYRSGPFLGVDPADFARVTFWRDDFAVERLDALMAKLGASYDGVLVPCHLMGSRTEGDLIQLSVYTHQRTDSVDFRIAGCFDLFPTWYPDESALFVGNLDYLHRTLGQTYPYEVWLDLAPGLDYVDISETTIGGVNIYKKGWGWDAPRLDIHREQEQPRRQGLLGLLSVGFLAAAGLSVLGFILYLHFSFRQRMVEFGVLRAVGLGVSQMGRILTWEIVLLLLISIGLGTGLGAGISRAFIPYLQIDIPGQSTVPPYIVAVDWTATAGVYLLFGALGIVAVAILILLMHRMRLFEALKLGETL